MKAIYFMSGLMTLGMVSCSQDDGPKVDDPTPYTRIELTESQTRSVGENNQFAGDLFNKMICAGSDENLVFSPVSISTFFAMAINGASEQWQNQLVSDLGFSDVEALNEYYGSVCNKVTGCDNRVDIRSSNSVWSNMGTVVNESFLKEVKRVFSADYYADVDLYSASSMNQINKWCSDKTNGLITNFLEQPVMSPFALFNAVYFKGKWECRFDKSATARKEFNNADGSTYSAWMMKTTLSNAQCAASDKWSAVRLPYGNGAVGMTVILPNEGVSLQDVARTFTTDYEDALVSSWTAKANVEMPRFRVESKTEVSDVEGTIFENVFRADYSGISEGFELRHPQHTALIIVDEEGTEAAAVTGGALGGIPANGKNMDLTLDRPFMYVISEKSTGMILFMGAVMNLDEHSNK